MSFAEGFSPKEFVCKCDGCTAIPPEFIQNVLQLVQNLAVLRAELKKPIIITSGMRCKKHNAAEGGAKASKHLTGEAADIRVEGMSGEELKVEILELIKQGRMHDGGIGTYKSLPRIVHYDIGKSRRW